MSEPVAIGVDVGGTKLVAASVAADGRVLTRHRRATPAQDVDALLAVLGELVDELGGGELPVGVGIAGLVEPGGLVRYGPNLALRDVDLRPAVAAPRLRVVNDASAAALGEQRIGAARGRDHMALLTLGTGVGGGVVVDGRLLLGARGFAGELGHLIVEDGGRRCPCGARGCLEAYASGTAIGAQVRERLAAGGPPSALAELDEVDGRAVTRAAQGGDALAVDVLTAAGRRLGVAIATLVNALDPELVLLGGGAALETSPWMLPAAREEVARTIIGRDWREPPPIELAALGDDAGMVGAALLAADEPPHPGAVPADAPEEPR